MDLKKIAHQNVFFYTKRKFTFQAVIYSTEQMTLLQFIWLQNGNGQFVKRADICEKFGVSYGRLLYENGSLRKLIDNGLISEIRNNQKYNAVFYVTNLGQDAVKQYLLMLEKGV